MEHTKTQTYVFKHPLSKANNTQNVCQGIRNPNEALSCTHHKPSNTNIRTYTVSYNSGGDEQSEARSPKSQISPDTNLISYLNLKIKSWGISRPQNQVLLANHHHNQSKHTRYPNKIKEKLKMIREKRYTTNSLLIKMSKIKSKLQVQ